MKRVAWALALWLSIAVLSSAHARAARYTVTINLPPNTPHETIYLTGSVPELCDWQPQCLELKEIGHGVRQVSFTLSSSAKPEMKITRGSWATEATDQWGVALPNFKHTFSIRHPEFVGRVLGWKDIPPTHPGSLLQTFPRIASSALGNSRTVRILLPESYHSKLSRRYPVIYMHDGQNLFDSKTSGFGFEWNIDEVLYSMARQGVVGEAIVVGIDSTADRGSEYDYFSRGKNYAQFLVQTVKPWVDQTYRTHADRESTFTMGASMGALISLALVWHHPDVFSKAAALSLPAFARKKLAQRIIDSAPPPAQTFGVYVDYGDTGGDAEYVAPGREFIAYARKKGLAEPELMHREFPYADHNEADWARRVDIPLKWMLGP